MAEVALSEKDLIERLQAAVAREDIEEICALSEALIRIQPADIREQCEEAKQQGYLTAMRILNGDSPRIH